MIYAFLCRTAFKSRQLALGLAVGFCVVLTGCVPRDQDDRTRILYSFWGSTEQQVAEQRIVDAFMRANPDIEVEILPIGARYGEKIQAMLVGNVAPDVIMVEMGSYFDWASRGLLEPLDDVLPEDRKDQLMPVPENAFTTSRGLQAMPVNCSGAVMFVNLEALEAAGLTPDDLSTWEKIHENSPKLSRRGGNPDAPTDFAVLMGAPMSLLWNFGGQLFDDPKNPTKVVVNSEETRKAFEFIRKIRQLPSSVPPDVSADEGTYQLFRDGRVALYFNGRWMTPEFAGRTDFEWDVFSPPSGPVNNMVQHGGTGLAVWTGSRQKEAAKRFVQFYGSAEGTQLAMEGGRITPVYRDLAFSDEFIALAPPESMTRFSETMEDGASMYPLYAPGGAEIQRIFRGRVEQLFANPNLSEEAVIEGLERDLNRWLVKFQRAR